MPNLSKKEVRRAIAGAKDMLVRNTDPCERFEGVLSHGYVRALRKLVALGERYIAKDRPSTRRMA